MCGSLTGDPEIQVMPWNGLTVMLSVYWTVVLAATVEAVFTEHPDIVCDSTDATCEDADLVPFMHRNMSGRRCFCDEDCEKYGDCCQYSATPRDESLLCTKIPFHVNNYVGIYAKSFCSDGSYCQIFEGDPLTQLPTFSRKSETAYRNLLCAVCNGESTKDLEYGNVTFNCQPEMDQKDVNVLSVFNKNQTDSEIHKYCDYVYYLPGSAENAKTCFYTVDTCPADSDPQTNHRCVSYMGTLFRDEILYKNIYCADCNGADVTDISFIDCVSPLMQTVPDGKDLFRPMDSFDISKSAGYSMTLLLDLNLQDGNDVGSVRRCPEEMIFDPWFQQCRKVQCPSGRHFQDGSCRLRRGTTTADTKDNYTANQSDAAQNALPDICPKVSYQMDQYAVVDGKVYINSSGKSFNHSDVVFNGSVVAVCLTEGYEEFESSISEAEIVLSIVCFAVSLCCLTLHFSVYILAGKYKLVPDLNMLAISVAIFFAHIFFILAPIAERFKEQTVGFCAASGILLHYFYLCSFAWSSVIAYDLTKSVLSLEHSSYNTVEYSNLVRYSIFGWIAPAIPIAIGLTLDSILPDSDYSPVYGQNLCWINRRRSLWVLFGAPVALVVVANFVCCMVTTTVLYKSSRKRSSLKTNQTKTSGLQTQFVLYAKLAIIMGLAWIAGFFAILWWPLRYLSILVNGLQGLYIFLAFSCKKSNLKSMNFTQGSLLERLHSMGSKKSLSSNMSTGSANTVKVPAGKSLSQLTTKTSSLPLSYGSAPGATDKNSEKSPV